MIRKRSSSPGRPHDQQPPSQPLRRSERKRSPGIWMRGRRWRPRRAAVCAITDPVLGSTRQSEAIELKRRAEEIVAPPTAKAPRAPKPECRGSRDAGEFPEGRREMDDYKLASSESREIPGGKPEPGATDSPRPRRFAGDRDQKATATRWTHHRTDSQKQRGRRAIDNGRGKSRGQTRRAVRCIAGIRYAAIRRCPRPCGACRR